MCTCLTLIIIFFAGAIFGMRINDQHRDKKEEKHLDEFRRLLIDRDKWRYKAKNRLEIVIRRKME